LLAAKAVGILTHFQTKVNGKTPEKGLLAFLPHPFSIEIQTLSGIIRPDSGIPCVAGNVLLVVGVIAGRKGFTPLGMLVNA